jgi:NAD(P)H-hydrate epimerase
MLRKSRVPVILTPHAGEMLRLLRKSEVRSQESEENMHDAIEQDRIETAISFAKKNKTYLVLKGAPTITATPEGSAFINSSGNPGMATAGTGDVLTGMISALLAQHMNARDASILGVYLHGVAGDTAARQKGVRSLVASDIIKAIPSVIKSLTRE